MNSAFHTKAKRGPVSLGVHIADRCLLMHPLSGEAQLLPALTSENVPGPHLEALG